MAILLGDSFSYQGQKPLDSRIKYNTLAEMVAMADSTLYDGCIAYCVGEDKNYQWKSTNTVDATTGKWRELEAGGGSEYTAGYGIDITENEISTERMQSSEIGDLTLNEPGTPFDPTIVPEVYAFQIDTSVSNPATAVTPFDSPYGCDNLNFTPAHMDFSTGKFDYGSWTGEEFFSPKPCVLNYDGTVAYYLDPDDYTKKADGTSATIGTSCPGNVMVEFPTIWFKRWRVNNINYCVISNKKLDKDFKAYAHMDINGGVADKIYISAYDGSYISGKLRSISGISANNTGKISTSNYICNFRTRQQEVDLAKANNVRTDCEGWNVWHKAERDMVNDLLILLGMSLNTQAVFGRGRDTGYSSTTSTGVVATGSMNTKGLFWGENAGAAGVKVFGIENWWGNLWKNLLGWINDNGQQKIKMTFGREDGSLVRGYNFTGEGYIPISGAIPSGTSGGYVNKWEYSEYGMIPYQVSGSESTYLCDGLWFDNARVDYALVGGASSDGVRCGAFCLALSALASVAGWHGGAALSFKSLA